MQAGDGGKKRPDGEGNAADLGKKIGFLQEQIAMLDKDNFYYKQVRKLRRGL